MNSLLEKEIYKKFTFKNAINSQGTTDTHDKMKLMVFLIVVALQLEFSTLRFSFCVYFNEATVSEYKRPEKFLKRLLEMIEIALAHATSLNVDIAFAATICLGIFLNRWIMKFFRRNHIIVFSIGFMCCMRLAYSVIEMHYHKLCLMLVNLILIGLVVSNLLTTFMEVFPDEIITKSIINFLLISNIIVEIALDPISGFGLNQIKSIGTLKTFLLLSFIYFTIVFMLSFMLLLESPHYLISINKKSEAILVLNNLIYPTKLNMTEVYFTISNMESELEFNSNQITFSDLLKTILLGTESTTLNSIWIKEHFYQLAYLSFLLYFSCFLLQSTNISDIQGYISSTWHIIGIDLLICVLATKFNDQVQRLRATHLLGIFILILSIVPYNFNAELKFTYILVVLFLKKNFMYNLIINVAKVIFKLYSLNSTKLAMSYLSKLEVISNFSLLLFILLGLAKTSTDLAIKWVFFDN